MADAAAAARANTRRGGAVVLPAGVSRMPTVRLMPYARNARTHSGAQIEQLVASMLEFGFTSPVLVDELGEIIAGHGRVIAAELLGLAECPVVVLAHLTPAQRRAYRLADNRIALSSGWDEAMLSIELRELDTEGFDLDVIGFSDAEIDKLLGAGLGAAAGGAADDAEPEADDDAGSSFGDRFEVAPLSVLDAGSAWWRKRRAAWLGLGIRGIVGAEGVEPGAGIDVGFAGSPGATSAVRRKSPRATRGKGPRRAR